MLHLGIAEFVHDSSQTPLTGVNCFPLVERNWRDLGQARQHVPIHVLVEDVLNSEPPLQRFRRPAEVG
jgi:hypothetical protein